MLVGRKIVPDSTAILFPRQADVARRERLRAEGWPDYEYLGSHRLPEHPAVCEAELIHLHNIQGGYFNPFSLIALSQSRPLVWSIHDMQPLTGYCSHALSCRRWQIGCGECPDLTLPGPPLPFDNTAALWRDKKLIADNSRLWIVGASDWMVGNLKRSLLSEHPIYKIPNGIHTKVFHPTDRLEMRAKLGLPADALIVGSLARSGVLAHPWKGGPHARVVLDALRLEYPELIYLNLGSTQATGEPWIRDIAPATDESLREHLGALDFFLHPSIADTAPLAVLEALACGLPVAAFHIGGIPDMVRPNVEGFLAPEGDTAALVEIAQVLARDPELRHRLGASSRERATTVFDVQHMADGYERLYHEVIVAHAGKKLPRHTAINPPNVSQKSVSKKADAKLQEVVKKLRSERKKDEKQQRQLVRHPWVRLGRSLHIFPGSIRKWLKQRNAEFFPKVKPVPANQRVLGVYLRTPALWEKYPLALLDVADKPFHRWLETASQKHYAFTELEIAAFQQETAAHPVERLVFTYLIQADWQKLYPQALQSVGATAFLQWIDAQKITAPPLSAFLSEAVRWQSAAASHFLDKSEPIQPDSRGINVLGHFCYPSGLGEVTNQTVRLARFAGYAVSCRDIPVREKPSLLDRRAYLGLEIYPTSIIQLTPNSFYETAYERAGLHRAPGIRRIGVVSWELPNLPWPWLAQPNWLDEIWAPTRFIKDTLERAGVANTHFVLPSVNLSPFTPLRRSDFGFAEKEFLFLFMFDISSSLGRKNPLGLIHAFRLAFPKKNTGPRLVIKVSHGSSDPLGLEKLRQAASENNVILIDEVMTRERSYALLDLADAYISLHRSEGFGLSLAEAMLLGKPVIATNYSGNLDFMNSGNSLLVDSLGLIEVGQDAQPNYPSQGRWADPDLEQAAAHLRWVVENREAANALGKKARIETRSLLTLSAGAARLHEQLARAAT